jgi:cytochrome c oxidase assembly protein subunit 15
VEKREVGKKDKAQNRAVRRWSWASLAYFVVVVLGGAVVRTAGAGAGCGDRWPLCNGEFIPQHPRLTTIIEFAHRSTTAVAVILFTVMIVWTFRATPKKHAARIAALWTAALLLTESVLGAVLVLRHLVEKVVSFERVLVQSVHFTNTMLLLAAATLTAVFLREPDKNRPPNPKLRSISFVTLGVTLLTGAAGSVAALADTIYPSRSLQDALVADFSSASPALLRLRWLHPVCAVVLALCCAVLINRSLKLGRGAAALGLLVNLLVQITLGAVDVVLLAPTWIQVVHLLSADIFWISLIAITAPEVFPRKRIQYPSASAPGAPTDSASPAIVGSASG